MKIDLSKLPDYRAALNSSANIKRMDGYQLSSDSRMIYTPRAKMQNPITQHTKTRNKVNQIVNEHTENMFYQQAAA